MSLLTKYVSYDPNSQQFEIKILKIKILDVWLTTKWIYIYIYEYMMKTPKMRCRVPKKIERNRKKNTMRCFVIKKMEKEMEGLIKLKISKGS